ncbi:hypothetical protein BGZ80_002541 [Entomortierella chlamydospora]|uniref:BTB domain-containing protein n=1 Tax=Entomortierella chlamydospora TaxID=101097 RepID=A0A9P6T346_9FUNG|nr:hypothetical protein BGZ79_006898 [Entomortierella chlamydospora]KAG0021376.1 hypothetical protein BGZ80_002541 [Entomortierella chlamydospora]
MTFILDSDITTTIRVEMSANELMISRNFGNQTVRTSDGNSWLVRLSREGNLLVVGIYLSDNTKHPSGFGGFGGFGQSTSGFGQSTGAFGQSTSGFGQSTGAFGGQPASGFGQTSSGPNSNACLYKYLHLVPDKRQGTPDEITTTAFGFITAVFGSTNRLFVEAKIPLNKVHHENYVRFNIVLSGKEKLLEKQSEVLKIEPQDAAAKNNETMLVLLRDIYSVDVCFVFESDNTCSNVGLWAHRTILSKYKGFENAIQTACKDISSASNDMSNLAISERDNPMPSTSVKTNDVLGPLLIPVGKFTMATLCVLLRYIYTGQIKLSAEIDKHAISTTENSLIVQGIMSSGKESVRWHPLGTDSPWKFKDVTWGELLLASDHYGIEDLRFRCEDEAISTIDQSNVFETLFTTGCSFDRIKEAALNYIVGNMTTLFPKGKDPFAPHKNHPKCYELMIEIFHRKAESN